MKGGPKSSLTAGRLCTELFNYMFGQNAYVNVVQYQI